LNIVEKISFRAISSPVSILRIKSLEPVAGISPDGMIYLCRSIFPLTVRDLMAEPVCHEPFRALMVSAL
jgi:hypothetical protein